MTNYEVTQSLTGPPHVHRDPDHVNRGAARAIQVPAFLVGIICGMVLCLAVVFLMNTAQSADEIGPGIPGPGPGAVEPEPLEPGDLPENGFVGGGLPTDDPTTPHTSTKEKGGRGRRATTHGD